MAGREQVYQEVEQMFGQVPSWFREVPSGGLPGFWSTMRDFQLAETRIPNKYKELIGLAVSGATRCRYCALFHTEAARFFGATDEEIAEAALMAGHTMNASTFLNAAQTDYDTFREETLAMIAHVRERGAEAGEQPTQRKEQRPGGAPEIHA
jgi:AhpD family alkylhydroperoxidase